jgi:hypothetical protein
LTNDNLQEHKELIKMINELRHMDEIKGNFVIEDKKECETSSVVVLLEARPMIDLALLTFSTAV